MTTTLSEALTQLTVPDLKDLASHLPGAEKLGRKDELIALIAGSMLGSALNTVWSALDKLQQAAVAEATHHPLGEYSQQRFQARYQNVPAFSVAGVKSHGYSGNRRSALRLFIHYERDTASYVIPADLSARLKAFVPPPEPLALESSETLADDAELTIRLTEREALQEAVVMLRTLAQERVQVSEKTALPGAATLRQLTDKLAGGDFYPWVEKKDKGDQEIGPIKAFAWPLLLQAGGLAKGAGSRLTLSPAGVKALAAPPADVLRGLWRKWLKSTLLDEFSRIDAIKGQNAKGRVMTAIAPRRVAINEALQKCSVGRWVAIEEFSRFMQAENLIFGIAHDPWKLYLSDRQYGSLGYEGSNGWHILQKRYLLALLFEYAATLGIIDVAYADPVRASKDFRKLWGTDELSFLSRYDGLCYFRLTPLGAYVLGLHADYTPATIASTLALSVLPSLLIKVVRGTPTTEETLLLENWASPVDTESWRLDRGKALAAIERGCDIAELQRFLESRDDTPLPPPVETFIQQSARNGKALKLTGSALLVECHDSATAEIIAGHKETASLCLRAGAKSLVVRNDHLEKFRERVRLLGFGLVS
jgi:hypothetical protein